MADERTIEITVPPSDGRMRRVLRLDWELKALGPDPRDWSILWVTWSPGEVAQLRVTGPDSELMQRLVLQAAEDLGALQVGV